MPPSSPRQEAEIPVIDVSPLWDTGPSAGRGQAEVARAMARACRSSGFFYVKSHPVSPQLIQELERLSRAFFAQPLPKKLELAMEHAGPAWRGYFPLGGELTSGRPDLKEGIYFGRELGPEHPAVKAGLPLHGANLFPELPGFRETVLRYLDALSEVGQRLMRGIALSLGLPADYFRSRYTADPLVLFRIFHYPPDQGAEDPAAPRWGVGEHTDYGLLTILLQDDNGGLQVKLPAQGNQPARWIEAPVIPGSFVCNIGDMLDRMTGGLYRSTPHRVKNVSGRDRLSFPFFYDPNFGAQIAAIDTSRHVVDDSSERWDQANVHSFVGTYGDYLLGKIGRVFPELKAQALGKKS